MYFYIVLFFNILRVENYSQLLYDIPTPPQYSEDLCEGYFQQWGDSALFFRESTCMSYQETAEALQEQQCTLTRKRQRFRLWCLLFNWHVGNALCALHSTHRQNTTLFENNLSGITPRHLTYPSHCNAIDKCHIRLLASPCKKCKEKQSPIFFTSGPVTRYPMSYFSKSSRK